MEWLGTWVAALLTLGIFSFLYKDNPVYKATEAIFVGVSAAYWAVTYFFENLHGKLYLGVFPEGQAEEPQYLLLFGALLGVLMLFRLLPKIGWVSRWPLSFIVGATAGLYMMTYFVTNALNQVSDTMLDLIVLNSQGGIIWGETIGSLVVLLGVVSGLVYFFFSKEHKGAFGFTAKVGIWFLMVTFGASFGYTVMSRMSLLIGRLDFLFRDWLGMIG
jgi:hypothetical protein